MMAVQIFSLATILCLALAAPAKNRRCPEELAIDATCKPGSGIISQCILSQSGHCKAAIKALVAKKNVAICKDDAEHTEHSMGLCKNILHACPDLKGLDTCFRGDMSTPEKLCSVLASARCYAAINGFLAKKIRSKVGCMKIAQMLDDSRKGCGIGQIFKLCMHVGSCVKP